MSKDLDKKDWRILYQLCKDARVSHSKLGKIIGLSKNAVTYRISRLANRGIIKGFFTIIDHEALGYLSFNVLIRVKAVDESPLISYLKSHANTMVIDRLIGEWNLIVEFGCKNQGEFNSFIRETKSKFSDIIDTYEVHPPLESLKIEQLPVELVEEKKVLGLQKPGKVDVDQTDITLLYELGKNSTASLFNLAKAVGVTYETISARIKKLKKQGVIIRFSAKIGLAALGYDVYFLMIDLRTLSKEREASLKQYINSKNNIRFAFISATRPTIFIYIAVKKSEELNMFLLDIKEKFSDAIVSQKYLLSPEQLKYELFPEGLITY